MHLHDSSAATMFKTTKDICEMLASNVQVGFLDLRESPATSTHLNNSRRLIRAPMLIRRFMRNRLQLESISSCLDAKAMETALDDNEALILIGSTSSDLEDSIRAHCSSRNLPVFTLHGTFEELCQLPEAQKSIAEASIHGINRPPPLFLDIQDAGLCQRQSEPARQHGCCNRAAYSQAEHSLSKIIPNLYLGCIHDANDADLLARTGITHVLSLYHHSVTIAHPCVQLQINISDSPASDITSAIWQGTAFIHQALQQGGRVFVHCHAGISRSATIVMAYLMLHCDYTLDSAFSFVSAQRPCICPNIGFMGSLQAFGKILANRRQFTCVGEAFPFSPLERRSSSLLESRCSSTNLSPSPHRCSSAAAAICA